MLKISSLNELLLISGNFALLKLQTQKYFFHLSNASLIKFKIEFDWDWFGILTRFLPCCKNESSSSSLNVSDNKYKYVSNDSNCKSITGTNGRFDHATMNWRNFFLFHPCHSLLEQMIADYSNEMHPLDLYTNQVIENTLPSARLIASFDHFCCSMIWHILKELYFSMKLWHTSFACLLFFFLLNGTQSDELNENEQPSESFLNVVWMNDHPHTIHHFLVVESRCILGNCWLITLQIESIWYQWSHCNWKSW